MNTETVHIVDHGRGPQLSTSRITVQDLLPFQRAGASNEEIRHWLPSLTDEEITVLKAYIEEHREEVLRAEQDIKAHHDRQRAGQPDWTRARDHLSVEERKALLRQQLAQRKTDRNGADHPSR